MWKVGRGLIVFFCGVSFTVIAAERVPDAGSLLEQQQLKQRQLEIPRDIPTIEPEKAPSKLPSDGDYSIKINGFRLIGDITAFSEQVLLGLLNDAIGQSYTLDGLQSLAERVTAHYRQHGYFLARAYLPHQDVTEGIITIAIQEGSIDSSDSGIEINASENVRLNTDFAKKLFTRATKPGQALKEKQLERAILLINRLPGITAGLNLEPGTELGSTRATVSLEEQSVMSFGLVADNTGSRYAGAERLTFNAIASDLSGYGDELLLTANSSDADNRYVSLGYNSAVGYDDMRLGFNVSKLNYSLGKELEFLNAYGEATNLTLSASYPLILTRLRSLDINVNYDRKRLKDHANGTITNNKTIDVAKAHLNLQNYDSFEGGGLSLINLGISSGNLDLSGESNALVADQLGPQRHGNFSKLSYSFKRLQTVKDDLSLMVSVDGQLASKNLDSSEQLQMGGVNGVRAYPVGEASADEGTKFTIEARYIAKRATPLGDIQATLFYDRAHLKQFHNEDDLGLTTPNNFHIAGWGVGLQATRLGQSDIQLIWARKIGSNPLRDRTTGNDADGRKDHSRLWLTAKLYF